MRNRREEAEAKKPLSIEKRMNSSVMREVSPKVPVLCEGKDLRKRNVLRRE